MTDDALIEAVESIEDADPDSLVQIESGRGHFVIKSNEADQNVDAIDEALERAGYERDGVVSVPGMVQQNFTPLEDGGESE
ncbi:hypothetical protein [Haloparvum sedimenti]|uniref:hypothetical protein n=1 Tax=Haloparvum sedimenti TaxID=1678448 RepID=UPI00071E7312|nr:hypothetical protein [Haloparvum sedimenti]